LQTEVSIVDEPAPEELRKRRLARFDQPVNKTSQEEMNTVMQDLALTPKKVGAVITENTWSFSNLPIQDEVDTSSAPQDIYLHTPKRIAGFLPTSSPLFVTPNPPPSMVIDLTDD
jgi:hypothetical protein